MTEKPIRTMNAGAAVDMLVRQQMRRIVDFVGVWRDCGRPECRRAERCRDGQVACFDTWPESIRETLEKIARWDRFDGPYSEARRQAEAEKLIRFEEEEAQRGIGF